MRGDRFPGWGTKFRPIPCCGRHEEARQVSKRGRHKFQRREGKRVVKEAGEP